MKAVATRGFLVCSELFVAEAQRPEPGPDDVLVRVHATSVNPKDWKLNTVIGAFTPKFGTRRPVIIGDDLSGEVVAVGSRVTTFAPGDLVYGMDMRLRTAAAAEYARISAKRIALKPQHLSHEEAAVVPLAGLTAYQALLKGNLTSGQRILIIGASGGVGTFAVQLAKAMGAHVTGVCSGKNAELVRSLGADELVDYTLGDYRTSLGTFDLVFDATSYETPQSCRKLMTKESHFISTMGNGKAIVAIALAKLNPWGPKASLVVVESYTDQLDQLRGLIESGHVKPIIDSKFALAEINAAYDRSKSGRSRGKIAVAVA
jgi:alcohol dehydrogenase